MNLGVFQEQFNGICEERGLKGFFMDNGQDLVMCAGLYEVPENPYEIIDKQMNTGSLFYPLEFAVVIDPENDVEALRQFINWASKAETIKTLYEARDIEIPYRMRDEEAEFLLFHNSNHFNPEHNVRYQTLNAVEIEKFFKKEKRRGFISKAWREYTRSPRYNIEGGILTQLIGFFRKHNQDVPINVLQEHSNTIKKITMKETDWIAVKNILQDKYPDMVYSASLVKKQVYKVKHDVDTGDKTTSTEKGVYDESTRDIFVCQGDEAKIAGIYNLIVYGGIVDRHEMSERLKGSELNYFKMPHEFACDFLILLMDYGIPFLVDDGKHTKNNLDSINVIYARSTNDHVQAIAKAVVASYGKAHVISELQKQQSLHEYRFSSPSKSKDITR